MSVRRYALDALTDITDRGAYANLRLKRLPDALTAQERKWASALVYTALDHLLLIDYILSHYVKRGTKPVIRGILRLGTCELLYFGSTAHAAVSEAVALTKEIGKAPLSGFVNAVLRTIDRERDALPPLPDEPVQRLSIQYSYPAWLVSEWVNQYGTDFTEELLRCPPAQAEVRAQYPCTADALQRELSVATRCGTLDENCLILSEGIDVAALPPFLAGRMTVQSESAMLVCRALGPCRGLSVLDACAAPGGKSAYIASLAENDVFLTCFELHPHRAALTEQTLKRLHVVASVVCRDATVWDAAYVDAFDAVLVDAPCSGLGLLNDKPDIRYAKTDADVSALAAVQQTLLAVNAAYVKPGGVLVYATCTISKRENQDVVSGFLATHPSFTLEPLPLSLENDGMLQLFPNVHGTDGFFIARMRRSNEENA